MTLSERNYNLLKPVLVRLAHDATTHDKGYIKLSTDGFMDLSVDVLYTKPLLRIAMAHNYIQNGDVVPDPDMEIEIDHEKKIAIARTFQDSYNYEEYNDSVNQDLQIFLNSWLTNLHNQGHFDTYEMSSDYGSGWIIYDDSHAIETYIRYQKDRSELLTFTLTDKLNNPIRRGEAMKTEGLTPQESTDLQNLLTQIDMVARSVCKVTEDDSQVKQECISDKNAPWNPKVSAKLKAIEDTYPTIKKGNHKNAMFKLRELAKFAQENITVTKGETMTELIEQSIAQETPEAILEVKPIETVTTVHETEIITTPAPEPDMPKPGGDVPPDQTKSMIDALMQQNAMLMQALADMKNATPKVDVVAKTITTNDKFNSIEIHFTGKPADDVIEKMRAENWRYYRINGDKKFWSNRNTDRNMQFANALEV